MTIWVLCEHILCKVVLGSEWLLNCLQLLDWWINISPTYASKFKFLRRRVGGKQGGGFRYFMSAVNSSTCFSFLYLVLHKPSILILTPSEVWIHEVEFLSVACNGMLFIAQTTIVALHPGISLASGNWVLIWANTSSYKIAAHSITVSLSCYS